MDDDKIKRRKFLTNLPFLSNNDGGLYMIAHMDNLALCKDRFVFKIGESARLKKRIADMSNISPFGVQYIGLMVLQKEPRRMYDTRAGKKETQVMYDHRISNIFAAKDGPERKLRKYMDEVEGFKRVTTELRTGLTEWFFAKKGNFEHIFEALERWRKLPENSKLFEIGNVIMNQETKKEDLKPWIYFEYPDLKNDKSYKYPGICQYDQSLQLDAARKKEKITNQLAAKERTKIKAKERRVAAKLAKQNALINNK
jgi:hypothetical protein